VNKASSYSRVILASIVVWSICVSAVAQQSRPDFEGMWSDPPTTAEDLLCFLACTDGGIEYLQVLLDDPENLDRPSMSLIEETWMYQVTEHTRSFLTPTGLEGYPLDMAQDPGLTRCEPWGFARQIFVPHQMEVSQFEDRVEMHYAEWDTVRTIYLDDRQPSAGGSPTRLGHSIGRYEGETLVVETSGVRSDYFEGITIGGVKHSDEFRAIERYSRPENGDRLEVAVVFEDPVTLTEPFHLKRAWGWAPDEEIYEYECEPDELLQ